MGRPQGLGMGYSAADKNDGETAASHPWRSGVRPGITCEADVVRTAAARQEPRYRGAFRTGEVMIPAMIGDLQERCVQRPLVSPAIQPRYFSLPSVMGKTTNSGT